MKRTTVFLEEALERDLRAIAEREGRPMAGVVREALEGYVAGRKRGPGIALSFLAVGRSGRGDTAETHEEWLWRDLRPHAGAGGPRPEKPRSRRASRKPRTASARPPRR